MHRVITFIRLLNLSNKSTMDTTIEKMRSREVLNAAELVKELAFNIGTTSLFKEFIEQQQLTDLSLTEKSMTGIIDSLYSVAIRAGGSYRVKCRACSGWHEILTYLVSMGYDDLHDLVDLLDSTSITGKDGNRLPCYSLKDAMNLVSSYTGNEYEIVSQRWVEGAGKDIKTFGPGNPQMAKAAYTLIDDGVIKKAEYGAVRQIGVTPKYFCLEPPWRWADIPFGSIGWRMGGGEDYLEDWFDFWDEIDQKRAVTYARLVEPPESWREWFSERIMEKKKRHNTYKAPPGQ